jgi:CDP-diacylglycerol--glycerol-3-phosphate 3-phosphatidyltransferase
LQLALKAIQVRIDPSCLSTRITSMSTETENSTTPPSTVFNVPNQLTTARLVLSILVFVLIAWERFVPALVVFVVAASTDWIDGYWARRYGQVTKLGRIFDPFVDKFIICGTFIFLSSMSARSGIDAWLSVVIVGRELLVTAIRSVVEQGGGDFSAKWVAKWKMGFQCIAAGASLAVLAKGGMTEAPAWMVWVLVPAIWLTLITTVYSGLEYLVVAWRTIVGDASGR